MPSLFGEDLRCDAVGHHQESDRFQAEFAGQPEVLNADVGLGAMRGDPHDGQADVLDEADVVERADARHHQGSDLGVPGAVDRCLHQQSFVGERKPIVERRPSEAVAVGDLDHGHANGIERGDDVTHMLLSELMTLGVRPVT